MSVLCDLLLVLILILLIPGGITGWVEIIDAQRQRQEGPNMNMNPNMKPDTWVDHDYEDYRYPDV